MFCKLYRVFALLGLTIVTPGMMIQGLAGDNSQALIIKPELGLMWVADPNYMVQAGLSEVARMPRTQALQVLARMNAGDSDNFGYGDWRLPTAHELRIMLGASENVGKNAALAIQTIKENEQKPTDVLVWPIRGSGVEIGFVDVAVFATNSAYLKEHATIFSGNVVVNDSSSGPYLADSSELVVGIRASTPVEYFVAADSIKIKSNGVVGGDALFNDIDNNGTIAGNQLPIVLPVFDLLPTFVAVPVVVGGPVPDDITINSGDTLDLDSGTYGTIKIKQNGTLNLIGNEYNMENFDAGTGTTTNFTQAGEFRVHDKFAVDQNSYFGPAAGSLVSAADIIVYVEGVNGNNGNLGATPKAAKVGLSAEFFGTIYAPNGTIWLRQNSVSTGAFLGRDVQVGDGAEVYLDSFFRNRSPVIGEDSFSLANGSTTDILATGEFSLLANDFDPEDNNMFVTTTPVSGPSHGTLTLNEDGTFSYTHDGSATSTDSFIYEVCDDGVPVACAFGQVDISIVTDSITVTIAKAGGDGFVSSEPAGLSCGEVCVTQFGRTQVIFLQAIADPGFRFNGWSGDADCFDGVLAPNGNKNCVANFVEEDPPPTETITVNITKTGTGSGFVASSPEGIDCGEVCSADFLQFTRIELTAIADEGSTFAGWEGDADCADGNINGDVSADCVAIFNEAEPPPETFNLRVIVLGSGSGTVSSSPFGLFCIDDCTIAFPAGTLVTLFERPDGGSTFVEWGGDCSGTEFSTQVLMDGDKTCTATFQ